MVRHETDQNKWFALAPPVPDIDVLALLMLVPVYYFRIFRRIVLYLFKYQLKLSTAGTVDALIQAHGFLTGRQNNQVLIVRR